METEKIKVGGVMLSDGRAIIKLMSVANHPDVPGVVLRVLGSRGVNIEFLVESFDLDSSGHMTLCIDQRDLETALTALEESKQRVGAKGISYHPDVVVVSLFGPHFREKPRISGIMFSALASMGVNSLAISTSISSLSVVVESQDLEITLQALEEAFDIPQQIRSRPKDY
jgi:aspartokinase